MPTRMQRPRHRPQKLAATLSTDTDKPVEVFVRSEPVAERADPSSVSAIGMLLLSLVAIFVGVCQIVDWAQLCEANSWDQLWSIIDWMQLRGLM